MNDKLDFQVLCFLLMCFLLSTIACSTSTQIATSQQGTHPPEPIAATSTQAEQYDAMNDLQTVFAIE